MTNAFEFPYLMMWTLGAPLIIAIVSVLFDGTMQRARTGAQPLRA